MAFPDLSQLVFDLFQLLFVAGFDTFFQVQFAAVVFDIPGYLSELGGRSIQFAAGAGLSLFQELLLLLHHLAVVLHTPDMADQLVELALLFRHRFFLVQMDFAGLFQGCFYLAGLHIQASEAILLLFDLCIERLMAFLQGRDPDQRQFDAHFFVFLPHLEVAARPFCLFLKCFEVRSDFVEEVFHAVQVFRGALQFAQCLALADFVLGHPGGLFEHTAARVFFILEDIVHHAEGDDGIRVGTDTRIQEERGNVFQSAGYVVEAVFTFSSAIEQAGESHRIVLGGQQVARVFEGQGDLCQAGSFALLRAVEDDAEHLVQAKFLAALFPEYPADSIYNIRFARPIWTDDADDVLIEVYERLVGKTFKTLYF